MEPNAREEKGIVRRPLLKPITLSGLTIDVPVALGPMAGVTDNPYREIAASFGCGLFYTEMVSAKALHYRNENTEALLTRGPKARPLGVQLFGSDPDIIGEEAKKLEDRFEFIDFNMGCPVPKVVKNHEGSYLLTQPELVDRIFTKLVQTVSKPVFVKIRSGFKAGSRDAVEIAKILENAGVSLVAIHARTRDQYYSGQADWSVIKEIKEEVKIPVIGNGDIRSCFDAERMIKETGCDGVMIGRAAEGNPWVFREVVSYLQRGEIVDRPGREEICEMILRHASLLIEEKGLRTGILEMRKHAAWYLQGTPGASKKRRALSEINSLDELKCVLYEDDGE